METNEFYQPKWDRELFLIIFYTMNTNVMFALYMQSLAVKYIYYMFYKNKGRNKKAHLPTSLHASNAAVLKPAWPCTLNTAADVLRGFTRKGMASVGPLYKGIFK